MTKTQRVKVYLLAQLKKPTAWRGLTMLLAGLGIAFSPEQIEAITSAGMLIAGAIGWLAPPDPE